MPAAAHLNNASFASLSSSMSRLHAHNIHSSSSSIYIVKEAVRMSIPLGLAAVAQMSVGVVLVAMVGQLVGVEELGATSLAFGLINATAFSFAAGFSGALETVLSQSYGRDPNSKQYGVYTQRMLLLLLIVSALLGPILAFADSLLGAIGQNPAIVYNTGVFCRVSLFGVYPVMLLEVLRRYFACQHLNTPLSVNLVVGAIIFPFLLWPMIEVFGFVGAPIAWVILMVGMPTSLLVYLIYSGAYKQTWGGWDADAFHDWVPLLKLALPSMAMMLSEWVSLEINAITAGFASPEQLAAFSVLYQTCTILWSLASGTFITASVMVGNALGQQESMLARRCALLCLACTAVVGAIDVVVVFTFRRYLPMLFSRDEKVWDECVNLIPYFLVYHFFDCIQSGMMGVLRGCGLQRIGALAIAVVYSLVGVPLGIVIFFTTSMGVTALWLGPAVGVSCVGFPIYVYLFFRYIDWDTLCLDEEDEMTSSLGLSQKSMSPSRTAHHHEVVFPDFPSQHSLSLHSTSCSALNQNHHQVPPSATGDVGAAAKAKQQRCSKPSSPTSETAATSPNQRRSTPSR